MIDHQMNVSTHKEEKRAIQLSIYYLKICENRIGSILSS